MSQRADLAASESAIEKAPWVWADTH